MIQCQILQTYITRTKWQMVRRITDEILGVEGLKHELFVAACSAVPERDAERSTKISEGYSTDCSKG